MAKGAYYNEIDPYAAQWLRNLIAAGEIADGDVDERSIEDVTPSELLNYSQCHFFAGIGIWSLALRNAGWDDTRRIWTGSCPCQPFSAAGKGDGFDDERHLWPHWFHLIEECSPEVVMGEQVASKDGLAWLDLVSADMEASNHTLWPVDTCVAGFGGPHLRQRLYWVAYGGGEGLEGRCGTIGGERRSDGQAVSRGVHDVLANTQAHRDIGFTRGPGSQKIEPVTRWSGEFEEVHLRSAGQTNGFWSGCDWIGCTDNYFRPVEPGTSPLADGDPTRVGKISAFGNAICAAQAQGFIESVM